VTTSQNKLNAGAEYLLYRIWATLQTSHSIHAESLLTCVGGLAGYACRKYAQQTRSDSSTALIDSPLSIWSLVSRAVLKLGEPLPDIRQIVMKASSEQATQLPDWHQPGHPAIVYLKQLWPQTLPIAQRFCPRPIHLPLLYGIALQRAIEHTKDVLSPTLAASISMECAIAMSRVELPESAVERPVTTATPEAATAVAVPVMRATPPRIQRETAPPTWLTTMRRVPPSARVAAIACLAFVTTAGAMYRSDSGDLAETDVLSTAAASAPPPAIQPEPREVAQANIERVVIPLENSPPRAEQTAPQPQLVASAPPADDDMPKAQPVNYGADNEGLMRDDSGQTIRMAAETEY
jgi:hypothetical protein